jgi:iron-sulfur cluster assembly protein
MAMDLSQSFRVQLTEKAAQVIRDAFTAEKVDPGNAFVRVGAKPGGCSGFKYDMGFAERSQVGGSDEVFTSQGINLVVDRACLTDVLGSVEIDYQDKSIVEQGFKFRPLDPATGQCGCGESFQAVKGRA